MAFNSNVAPAGAQAVDTAAKGATKSASEGEIAKFIQQGETLRSDERKQSEGSKAETLSFVAAIGNPRRMEVKKASGVKTPKVVGFILKSSEPITINRVAITDGDTFDFDVNATQEQIPANTEFKVNNIELGLLLARPEYAGLVFGDPNKKCRLHATYAAQRAGTNTEKLPFLTAVSEGFNLKDGIQNIATSTKDANGRNVWTIAPGFEAFEKFVATKQRATGNGTPKAKADGAEKSKNLSAAFGDLYSKLGITI